MSERTEENKRKREKWDGGKEQTPMRIAFQEWRDSYYPITEGFWLGKTWNWDVIDEEDFPPFMAGYKAAQK